MKQTKNKRRRRNKWVLCKTRSYYDSLPNESVNDLNTLLNLSNIVPSGIFLEVIKDQKTMVCFNLNKVTLSKEGAVRLLKKSRKVTLNISLNKRSKAYLYVY